MKKIVKILLFPLIGTLLMTSCLGDTEETELTSTVALLTFQIKDLKTVHTIQKDNGEDSTYTAIISGKSIKFAIDQALQKVYNIDSIAYGTDITQVLVNVTADGYVSYLKEDGNMGSIEDSIDFTHPVTFRVVSYDKLYTRDYEVSLHRHQVHPDSTQWKQISTNFPSNLFATQRAFIKGDQLYVMGNGIDGICYTTSTILPDASMWSDPVPCTGIIGVADYTTAMLVGDIWYLAADGVLYSSVDAVSWTPSVTSNPQPQILLASETGLFTTIWGADKDYFVSSDDMETWTANGQQFDKGIKSLVATFTTPLRSNGNINRTLFIALPAEANDTCAQVWNKLSTETQWVEIKPKGTNTYGCPHLENLTVIHYADKMYAFGGESVGPRKEAIEAFSHCFESADNGVTWKVNKKSFSLSDTFRGRNETFSAVTDGEFVWIIWSASGEVWRGRWNGIK